MCVLGLGRSVLVCIRMSSIFQKFDRISGFLPFSVLLWTYTSLFSFIVLSVESRVGGEEGTID